METGFWYGQDNLLDEEFKRKSSSKVIFSTQNEALVTESRGRNICIENLINLIIIIKDYSMHKWLFSI